MRHGASGAGAPARATVPVPLASPTPAPLGASGRQVRWGAYPGDDGGVPRVGREQQQEQQRDAAAVPHGALGTGGVWLPKGAPGWAVLLEREAAG